MEANPSPGRHRAEYPAWSVSARTRQEAQQADACMGPDDWLYEGPPAAGPLLPKQLPAPAPPRPPAH